jgi:16S rRNA processing protein RimM
MGEIKIYPDSDFPERFTLKGKRWLLSPDKQSLEEIELLHGRSIPGKNLYIISLAGIGDRSHAEKFRGYSLLVQKTNLPKLAQDEYHVSHLIGLEVFNQLDGALLGNIVDVIVAGQDILEVKPKVINADQKLTNYLIPFVKEIVPIVDLENKRVEINPPSGLLTINQIQ